MRNHRYTGEWPPVDVLQEIKNWDFALAEEGIVGQDETTIKPQGNQRFIDEETGYTVADVRLPNGETLMGVVGVAGLQVLSLDFFYKKQWHTLSKSKDVWTPLYETWLPEQKRSPKFEITDKKLFPMKVISRLPLQDGEYLEFLV